jgi:hypothetical protein
MTCTLTEEDQQRIDEASRLLRQAMGLLDGLTPTAAESLEIAFSQQWERYEEIAPIHDALRQSGTLGARTRNRNLLARLLNVGGLESGQNGTENPSP